MPLGEIAGNIRRSQSTNRCDSKDIHNGEPIAVGPRPPHLSVQGMLKSTTELGDVGMFAQRPPRVPRSNTQSSVRIQSRSSTTATHSHRYHQNDIGPSISHGRRLHRSSAGGLGRNDTVRSSVSSYQYQSRPRRLHPRPGPYIVQQQPQLQSSNRALHGHRSLTSLRSYNATSNHASLSPTSYRTRRTYHLGRAPSPAISNVYEYHNSWRPEPKQRGSVGTAASSPTSLVSAGRSIQDHRSEYNASVRSFRPLPSPAVGVRSHKQRGYQMFARSITPASSLPLNARFASTTSLTSGPASPTDSIVPFYYDYSESFHGADVLAQSDQDHPTIPEGQEEAHQTQCASLVPVAQSPFGTMPGSGFSPVELPTKHNRRVSEASSGSRHSRNASERSNKSTPVAITNAGNFGSSKKGRQPSYRQGQCQVIGNLYGQTSTSSPRNWPSPSESTFFTNASRSPRNLSNLAARAHSPLNEEVLRDISRIDIVATESTTPKQGADRHEKRETTATEDFELPTFKFRPLSIAMSPDPRPRSSSISSAHQTPEIVSPRPERPTSSQSRRRFSKILDVEQYHAGTETYSSGYPMASHSFIKLERVDEASSPLKTPAPITTSKVSAGKDPNRAFHHSSTAMDNTRWSGVTSHDKSTVESLLERHIECLGLKPGQKPASSASTHAEENTESVDTNEDFSSPNTITAKSAAIEEVQHSTSPTHRPTSLSTSAQKRLRPRRLFASIDAKFPKFPLASSESDARFSLSSHDGTIRPSYGWLTLPSECDISTDAEKSRQTLLSGDYADVESGQTVRKFKLRRHSSPSITPMPHTQDEAKLCKQSVHKGHGTPCRRSKSDISSQEASQRRRNMKIHLKNLASNSNSALKRDSDTTDQQIQDHGRDLAKMGWTRVPISAVDGFAELSGESANASQQFSTSVQRNSSQPKPDMWSGMVAAMPTLGKKSTGLRRKPSAITIRSVRSDRSIVEPVNTSRVASKRASREVKSQSSVPQLARPDLGPAMRASEFDLATQYLMKSPQPETSFSELKTGESPAKYGRHSMRARWRLNGLRHIIPKSPQSRCAFASPAATTTVRPNLTINQHCRVQRAVSFDEEPMYPETVAMSDFAYRKHKIMEKFREWCRRQCLRRPAAMKRGRSVRAGGFLVD
ncbi:hypothetical protein H2198_004118 [Neophaeococcomyces mojaviensis]|uniref:Uncharacterized protein n=1 Tax=Neophaeococcomyces mojaviensis TaxID=3383035 RepID=A0ACC3A9G3_9EURO|nr:hypothetical protein H2198_004118 [Knufia sp. JES_112]